MTLYLMNGLAGCGLCDPVISGGFRKALTCDNVTKNLQRSDLHTNTNSIFKSNLHSQRSEISSVNIMTPNTCGQSFKISLFLETVNGVETIFNRLFHNY